MKKQKPYKRYHTQQTIDKDLDKMLFLAAQQKLLPKIIYQYSYQHNSPKFINKYRESVKQIYTKQTAHPLKYSQEDAKTHRQKFRQKIIKLINNQLPVDYLQPIKINNNQYVMGYKGLPLEKIKYQTKPQFQIFSDFSQNKFKKGYIDIFEDKLQYRQTQLTKSIKKQQSLRAKTKPNQYTTQQSLNKNLLTPVIEHHDYKQIVKIIPTSLPKLIARTHFDRSKLQSPKTNTKKKIKLPKNINYQKLILEYMTKIGKYTNISSANISITKQSILKYFRQCYQRPHRVVDFLEFSDVQNFNSYSKIPQKLKLMSNQHIYFMSFLFYDSNNDGYICSNDLIRIQEISKKCPLLIEDCQIIRNGAHKIKFETKLPYLDLYRYPEVTQTTYFNWLKKKNQQNPQSGQDSYNEQLKDYFQQLNKKKIYVHYEGFKKLFEGQKPFLWYDLLYRLSGVKYEGLKYQ